TRSAPRRRHRQLPLSRSRCWACARTSVNILSACQNIALAARPPYVLKKQRKQLETKAGESAKCGTRQVSEDGRQSHDERRAPDGGNVGGGPPLIGRTLQALRRAGIECEIVDLVPAETSVLRRDRVVIVLALALVTLLAWSYLLW